MLFFPYHENIICGVTDMNSVCPCLLLLNISPTPHIVMPVTSCFQVDLTCQQQHLNFLRRAHSLCVCFFLKGFLSPLCSYPLLTSSFVVLVLPISKYTKREQGEGNREQRLDFIDPRAFRHINSSSHSEVQREALAVFRQKTENFRLQLPLKEYATVTIITVSKRK